MPTCTPVLNTALHLNAPAQSFLAFQVLPKDLRPAAAAAKKRAARVAERLSAVAAALRLLGGHSGGKAPAKLAKALAALDKAKVIHWLSALYWFLVCSLASIGSCFLCRSTELCSGTAAAQPPPSTLAHLACPTRTVPHADAGSD